MAWQHFNPVHLLSAAGLARQLMSYLPSGHCLLITSPGMQARGTAHALMQVCPGQRWTVGTVTSNPAIHLLDDLSQSFHAFRFAAIVALGGGSVIDAAKVLSVSLHPQAGPRPLAGWLAAGPAAQLPPALPLVCLPSTAGTGAELTPFATVWDTQVRRKRSLEAKSLYPDIALLDGELSLGLPAQETLFTGLDATAHALESLWNRHATPVSCSLAIAALERIVIHLPRVLAMPSDLDGRQEMLEASALAGLAISQNRSALAHSISYPLTARYGVPHGLACGFTLAALVRRVQQENAFVCALPDGLLEAVLRMLDGFSLRMRLPVWCTAGAVLACVPEMFEPSRAGNFVLPVDEALIRQVLQASLAEV